MKLNKYVISFVVLLMLYSSIAFCEEKEDPDNDSYIETAYAMSSLPQPPVPLKTIASQPPVPLKSIPTEPYVCFSSEDAKRLTVELEKCKIVEKNIVMYYNSNVELSKQIELLKEEIELLNQKYQVAEDLEKKNEEIYAQKIKVYETELADAKKPKWGAMFGSFGLGALVAAVLCIAL